MNKNPVPFTLVKDEHTGRFEGADKVKHVDCTFYNACLDTAIESKWKGFGCGECQAYQAAPQEQKYQDMLGLLAARLASDNVARMGNAGRRLGGKPGQNCQDVRRLLKIAQ